MSEPRRRLTFPALTDAEALDLLDKSCTDFSIHNRDWPQHGFRWEVCAFHFFCRGRGVGQDLGEAVQRALRHMNHARSSLPRATDEDYASI